MTDRLLEPGDLGLGITRESLWIEVYYQIAQANHISPSEAKARFETWVESMSEEEWEAEKAWMDAEIAEIRRRRLQ